MSYAIVQVRGSGEATEAKGARKNRSIAGSQSESDNFTAAHPESDHEAKRHRNRYGEGSAGCHRRIW